MTARAGEVHVALLRGVNVGGANRIRMADLRAVLEGIGLSDVRTLLQSGNAIFRSPRRATPLGRRIEAALAEQLRLRVRVHVRSSRELQRIVARNPFTAEATSQPALLHVLFLDAAATRAQVAALHDAARDGERFHAGGMHLYGHYPHGAGRSRIAGTSAWRALGDGTARNWNTLLGLVRACSAEGGA